MTNKQAALIAAASSFGEPTPSIEEIKTRAQRLLDEWFSDEPSARTPPSPSAPIQAKSNRPGRAR
jgi:hypothetical protein